MSDINKLWSILKSSSMNDKDMQKAFVRAATPNACIELLESIDCMEILIEELERTIATDQLVKANAKTDKKRLDWLGDPENKIGNVMLPTECIEAGLIDGLRGAIDEAMKMEKK